MPEFYDSRNATTLVISHDHRIAGSTHRILSMQDGRIVDDHRVADAAAEELRSLARSQLGQSLLAGNTEDLTSLGLAQDGQLTADGAALKKLLDRAVAG